MRKHLLITGGAGFIGSHVAEEMLRYGYRIRVLDNLSPQVHGAERKRPDYLDRDVELTIGDVRDPVAVEAALDGIDAVYHFVAAVGVGQSMYRIAEYTSINNLGTAVLLEALVKRRVERLIVASSMSVYGEGLYKDSSGTIRAAVERTPEQLRLGDWEVRDDHGEPLTPLPTPETKPISLSSVYALSKYDQERMCLMVGRAYKIDTVALRFFNVYGPNQALSNPYTGVLSNFASRLLNGKPPLIFEDGKQKRDLISVRDIARACRLALEIPGAAFQVMNVATGRPLMISEIAGRMARVLGKPDLQPEIKGKYRSGDIRHCYADITLAKRILGFEPAVTLEDGIENLAAWLDGQVAIDRGVEARAELAERGLMV
ncbi:MAG: NAD-dependent epimerase/dehydratase family protein [Acidobacteriota bacterium]|nr:NAD-dependent epimerase/dehydratase family protein [Acidobacteriota bacterium]